MIDRDGVLFFCSGSDGDMPELLDLYAKGAVKSPRNLSASAFFVKDGQANMLVCSVDLDIETSVLQESDGMGTGSDWAIAALDFKKTAKEAVEYAATKDIYTGGIIREFKIGSN